MTSNATTTAKVIGDTYFTIQKRTDAAGKSVFRLFDSSRLDDDKPMTPFMSREFVIVTLLEHVFDVGSAALDQFKAALRNHR